MKQTFWAALALGGLLVTVPGAFSQDRDDQYHHEQRNQAYWNNHLFDRVRADIEHVQSVAPFFSGEQFNLTKAKHDLNELQSSAVAGRFDAKELDEVLTALQKVTADRRLSDRDRNMINDDVARLREYREHHERYYTPRG